jgi:hypothetical protein
MAARSQAGVKERLKPAGRAGATLRFAAAFLALFGMAAALQLAAGAYRDEFSGHPDEPAHYVTALMVHDYIAAGFPPHPFQFAEDFYLHYPKMALGHWPPFFYILQAAWMMAFPTSHASVIALMAALAAALALTVCIAVRNDYGWAAGLAAAALLLALPLVQQFDGMVMTEIPVALLCLWATLFLGRYLETASWRDSAGFGIVASLAIMTKGSALALALAPPIALALSARWHLLKRLATWLPAGIAGLLCGPWYFLTLRMAENGWTSQFGPGFVLEAALFNTGKMIMIAGPPLAAVAALGVYAKARLGGKWAALAALIASVWIFQSLVPASIDERHLLTAAPPAVIFIAPGIEWLARRFPLRFRYTPAALATAAGLLFTATSFAVPPASDRALGPVASLLLRPDLRDDVILVSSQFDGEGIVIAQVAEHERRPGHIILRGSKVLAESTWEGTHYRTLYKTPAEVMKFLDGMPVGVIVLDNTPGHKDHPHHRQLQEAIHENPARFRLLGTFPADGRPRIPGEQVLVYQVLDTTGKPTGKIRIDMKYMMNRSIGG